MNLRQAWRCDTGDSGLKNPCANRHAVFIAGNDAIHEIDVKNGHRIHRYAFTDFSIRRSPLESVKVLFTGFMEHNGPELTDTAVFVRGLAFDNEPRCWAWSRRSRKPLSKFKPPPSDYMLQNRLVLDQKLDKSDQARLLKAMTEVSFYGQLSGVPIRLANGTFVFAMTYIHSHYCCFDGYCVISVPAHETGWSFAGSERFSRCTGPLLCDGRIAVVQTLNDAHEMIELDAASGQERGRNSLDLDGHTPTLSAGNVLFSVCRGSLRADILSA